MQELVILKNKEAVTTSLQVAESFDKKHRHVLTAIDELKEGVAENWADLFWEDTYVHPQNKQSYRIIYMNRDGFSLLAMGFTGKKALSFKLQYIEAFNKMEKELKDQLTEIVNDILAEAHLKKGDLFVLGCSTSEVVGGHIGKNSSAEVGQWIIRTLKELLDPKEIALAVQGCEHLNRALVVERTVAEAKNFEIVSVVPALHAGGACSVAAFDQFNDPVEVEHVVGQAGIDIGDTSIGMHIKHVQVPVRPRLKTLGQAHVTALRSRPKYIGGPRANY
ncbi:TPA: TIGR01440 family protein [Enterococcus faecium]|nr:TIGR01440 family protein [Enterococcus faecium]